jgi:hypothetical protein
VRYHKDTDSEDDEQSKIEESESSNVDSNRSETENEGRLKLIAFRDEEYSSTKVTFERCKE